MLGGLSVHRDNQVCLGRGSPPGEYQSRRALGVGWRDGVGSRGVPSTL